MKTKKLMLIMFALIGVLLITSGCPGPLSFSGVRNPNVIVDGAGGAIVTYQVNENETRTTYVQKLDNDGGTLWSGKGKVLYSEPGSSEGGGTSVLLVNSDNRSTVLIWEQADSIWTQKIDSEGSFLWGAGNVRVADGTYGLKVASDGSGGVIVAWSDADSNLNLQRIDSQGDISWEIDTLAVKTQFFDVSVDGPGNTLVVWEDRDFNVLVQKLDSAGMVSWPTGSVLISETHGPGVGLSKVVSDGAGGAIVAWICGIRSEDKVGIIGQELYAQRIDTSGNTVWQVGGVPVCTTVQGDRIIFAIEPRLSADGRGSAIIFWREMLSIYAQKIDAGGNILWVKNGVQIWNGAGAQGNTSSNVVSENNGGAIVVWCYTPAGSGTDQNVSLRAQRVASDGQKPWGNDGISLSKTSPGYSFLPLISQDGRGGIIAAWTAGKNIHNAGSSYVQRVSADGKLLWGNDGIKLNS